MPSAYEHGQDCAIALLDARQTTMAGLVSLLRYVAEGVEGAFPDSGVLLDDEDDEDDGHSFSDALLLTVAGWLENAGIVDDTSPARRR
jgi:hypothetical protein